MLITGAAASFFIKVHQSQDRVTQYFLLWEEDLGQTLVLKQNHELLEKISLQLEDLDSSVAGSYVKMNSPDDMKPVMAGAACHFQTDIPMTLSNFPVGHVTVCFKTSELLLSSFSSPIFLFTLLLTFLFSSLAFHREGKKENALFLANQIANLSRQVAHDVRGPLMALKALSAQSQDLPKEKAQLLLNAIGRIHSIADDLLKKSKNIQNAQVQKKSPKLGFCILQNSLEELMPELTSRFPETSLSLKIQTQDPLMVGISKNELQRIVSNLVQNAAEACQASSEPAIVLQVYAKTQAAFLSIIDNGCGMEPEQIAGALNGKTFGKKEGNGLGLSHSVKVVKNFGGDLTCHSKLNEGTQILIKFPLAATSEELFVDHKS